MSGFLDNLLQRTASSDSLVRPRTLGLFESRPAVDDFELEETVAGGATDLAPESDQSEPPAVGSTSQPAVSGPESLSPVTPAPVLSPSLTPVGAPQVQRMVDDPPLRHPDAPARGPEDSSPSPIPEPGQVAGRQELAPLATTLLVPPVPASSPETVGDRPPSTAAHSPAINPVAPPADPVPAGERSVFSPEPVASPAPVINVSIGRIEVRAPAATPAAPTTTTAGPRLTLDDYLKKRDGEGS